MFPTLLDSRASLTFASAIWDPVNHPRRLAQFGNPNTSPRDPDGFAFGDPIQQAREISWITFSVSKA
jgi:hypothetical protein